MPCDCGGTTLCGCSCQQAMARNQFAIGRHRVRGLLVVLHANIRAGILIDLQSFVLQDVSGFPGSHVSQPWPVKRSSRGKPRAAKTSQQDEHDLSVVDRCRGMRVGQTHKDPGVSRFRLQRSDPTQNLIADPHQNLAAKTWLPNLEISNRRSRMTHDLATRFGNQAISPLKTACLPNLGAKFGGCY
jgi:hypothetical protein